MIVDSRQPRLYASSISSNASTAISTPPPKPMTAATKRCENSAEYAITAPSSSPNPAPKPQSPACNQSANNGHPTFMLSINETAAWTADAAYVDGSAATRTPAGSGARTHGWGPLDRAEGSAMDRGQNGEGR